MNTDTVSGEDNAKKAFTVEDTAIDRQIMARRRAHYNCAAATLAGILAATGTDADDDTLKHISAGFRGGIGGTHADGPCGALTGAVLALGILSEGDDNKTARLAAELLGDFRSRLGAVACADLKKHPAITPCDLCCLTAGRKVYEIMEREHLVHHRDAHHCD